MKDQDIEERAKECLKTLPVIWNIKASNKYLDVVQAAMKEERERGKRFFRWYTNYKNNTHKGQEDELFNEF